ncbi:MAG: hypothetical protein O6951_03595 [Actinobacteria bacterium]|nr:hypothetical protein [Actinomycetota bacterium]
MTQKLRVVSRAQESLLADNWSLRIVTRLRLVVSLAVLILAGSSAGAQNNPADFIGTNHTRGDSLLVLRLAISATGEYTQEVGGAAAAIANIDTLVAQINEIYGREYSVRFELIATNSDLVFTDPVTDPWPDLAAGSGCVAGAPILAVQGTVIDGVVGAANYDISHVFASSLGGGCGGGFMTGVSLPTIGILRHEMGHQFQQSHTINQASGARNANWAYELGDAGMSIQGGNSVANAHAASFHQLVEHLLGAAAGIGTETATGNTIPTVDAGPDRVIPVSTPFVLTGVATDPDLDDSLTYVWDQLDRGIAQSPPLTDDTEGPLFSRLLPSTEAARSFPQLSSILANTYTGDLENLPTQPRDINLRLTVNDNHMFTYESAEVPASGVNSDDVKLTVVDNGGPFQVTSPNTAAAFAGGSSQTVTWDVAGTELAPIATSNVRISLSADGGLSFPIVLAEATANDGSQALELPNIDTSLARAKVEAVGNVYFDVSDQDFTINQNAVLPGIVVAITGSSTLVSENGQTDTYTLGLLTAPAGEVTVLITADEQTEISLDGVTFTSTLTVSFTDTTSLVIVVRGKFDSAVEGPHAGSITHFVSATGDAANYPVGMAGTPLLVSISDAQIPPVAGVDFDNAASVTVPDHWVKFTQTLGQSALDIPLDDGTSTNWDIVTDATSCGVGGCSFDFGHNSGSNNSPQHVQDLAALGGVAASLGPVTATWSGLEAHTGYRVFVFAHYSLGGTIEQTVTITGDGTADPTPFTQTVGGALQVNDQTSTSEPLISFGKEVTSTAGGSITITVTPAANASWISGLAIQEVLGAPSSLCQAADVTLSLPQTTSEVYETAGTITSSQAISGAGVLVEYYANTAISLISGFQVGEDAGFVAGSTGCVSP